MREIQLTRGKVALVDDEDFELVSKYKWKYLHNKGRNTGYAQHSELGLMHRFLLQPPRELLIDHVDKDGLNNSRGNLRLATRSQNAMNRGKQRDNTSGYKGAYWDKRRGTWFSVTKINQKTIRIGDFPTALAAHEAYVRVCRALHGEFFRV